MEKYIVKKKRGKTIELLLNIWLLASQNLFGCKWANVMHANICMEFSELLLLIDLRQNYPLDIPKLDVPVWIRGRQKRVACVVYSYSDA